MHHVFMLHMLMPYTPIEATNTHMSIPTHRNTHIYTANTHPPIHTHTYASLTPTVTHTHTYTHTRTHTHAHTHTQTYADSHVHSQGLYFCQMWHVSIGFGPLTKGLVEDLLSEIRSCRQTLGTKLVSSTSQVKGQVSPCLRSLVLSQK